MIALGSCANRFLPPAVVMATIFVLSHQPGDELSLPALPGIDKIAHLVVYGLLAASLIRACSQRLRRDRPVVTVMAAVLICLLYGLTDEFHQSFVPGRFVSALDVLADTVGAILVGTAWFWRYRPAGQAGLERECSI